MHTQEAKKWFHDQMRDVLNALYDPLVMRKSPLIQILELDERRNVILLLRETLTRAIEALQPPSYTPREAKIWRTYHILRRRYVEQIAQREVALELGLSTRQLQRDEVAARETLAEYFWDTYKFAEKYQQWSIQNIADDSLVTNIPSREQELAYLHQTMPEQVTDINQMICDILKTLSLLLDTNNNRIIFSTQTTELYVYTRPLLLRQALISLISSHFLCTSDTRILVTVVADSQSNNVKLKLDVRTEKPIKLLPHTTDNLDITRHLIEMCGGQIQIRTQPAEPCFFSATISLPVKKPRTVLVIDDKTSTCDLFEHYLKDTCYHFIGIDGGQVALTAAIRQNPSVIVLDVMMAHRDGWELLGELRQHPDTTQIPIIICTILAQETLAYALGATGFLRKPVGRAQFLEALKQQFVAQA